MFLIDKFAYWMPLFKFQMVLCVFPGKCIVPKKRGTEVKWAGSSPWLHAFVD